MTPAFRFRLTPSQERLLAESGLSFYTVKARRRFLEMYGNVCALCGIYSNPVHITCDHINGDASEDRILRWGRTFTELGGSRGGAGLMNYACDNYNPNKYRPLCWECNQKERHRLVFTKNGKGKVSKDEVKDDFSELPLFIVIE